MNLIGPIDFNNSVPDFGPSELAGATGVVSAVVNGVRYVYVAGFSDQGIQVLRMAADGTLTTVSSIAYPGPYGLEVVVVGSETFLIAAAPNQGEIATFRIDDDGVGTDGHLVPVARYDYAPGTGQPTEGQGLVQSVEKLAQVTVGGSTYIFTAGYYSDALAVFRVNANGTLTRTDSALDGDDPDYRFENPYGVATHKIGNKAFVFIGGSTDNGISSFAVSSSGELTFVGSVTGVDKPYEMTAGRYNGRDLLFVSDIDDQTIQVYTIGANGALTFLSETPDYINGDYSRIYGLKVLNVDGVPFLIATAANQDAILVLSLDASDNLRIVQTFSDGVELNGANGFSIERMGDRVFLVVAAQDGNRVSVVEIGAGADPIIGTADDDRMVGHLGDDDLIGMDGNDELFGGAGDDVLSGRADNDTLFGGSGEDVLIGGDGNDLLVGGEGADMIVGGRGRDTLSYQGSNAAVAVNLSSQTVSGGDATGDQISGIENVYGSDHGDTIVGDKGRNLLKGFDGADLLDGRAGNDTLDGGLLNDTLLGGDGDDLLYGGQGSDSLDGGDGADKLLGGNGNDVLIGGDGNDTLDGGANNDTLVGGLGNDSLIGGAGRDVFVFVDGGGDDTVQGFEVALDRIDLTGVAALNSLEDVLEAAFTIAGNTFIDLGASSSITLLDVTEAQLTEGNFVF
jgi:Ca2+-binding RTX toxin-like protein